MRIWPVILALASISWAHAQTLQVVTEDTAYTYLEGGQVGGPATRIVRAALESAGVDDFRVNLYPWARAYAMATRQPNVLIYLIARTPERERTFKWAAELMQIRYHLYRLATRTDVQVTRLEDARHYAIGVVRDDVRHQYLQRLGFTQLTLSAGNEENFQKLLASRIDLIPLPPSDAAQLCEKMRFDCRQLQRVLTLDALGTGLYMAFSTGTADELVSRVGEAYRRLRAEGRVEALE